MAGVEKDISGNQYGYWTALKRSGTDPWGGPIWLFRCECGVEKAVLKSNVTKGKSRSCGCKYKELSAHKRVPNRLAKGEASMRQLYLAYEAGAKRRGLKFDLTRKDFRTLTDSRCHYCGTPPRGVNRIPTLNGSYVYNGIDRVDNRSGYVKTNYVPCCKRCNLAKGTSGYQEFMSWISSLILFRSAQERIENKHTEEV